MDDLRIRQATATDEPFLWRMLALAADAGRDGLSVEQVRADRAISRYLDDWGRPGDVGVVAERDGESLGAAWYRTFSSAAPAYGFVDETTPELSIACLPAVRGQGVGRALLDALLAQAKSDDVSAVSLSVALENEAAVELYLRSGFEPLTPSAEAVEGSLILVARLR